MRLNLGAVAADEPEVGQASIALVEVEAVADEELVGHREADVADGQVADEPAVGAVEQGDGVEARRAAQRERLAQVVQRQAGVDDVLDEQDVPAGDPEVEVLQEPDPRLAARLVRAVRGELDEVDGVGDRDRPRQVGEEDEARLQRGDENRVTAVVVDGDLRAELEDARPDVLRGEVELPGLGATGVG